MDGQHAPYCLLAPLNEPSPSLADLTIGEGLPPADGEGWIPPAPFARAPNAQGVLASIDAGEVAIGTTWGTDIVAPGEGPLPGVRLVDANHGETITPGRNAASCRRPPPGWLCSLGLDHEGTCAATRAKCAIPNASGAWECDRPWAHMGALHSSAGDGFYATIHGEEHQRRQTIWDDQSAVSEFWESGGELAPERRLDQAALREQAQTSGGGVDERRAGTAQSLTDEELAAGERGRARRHAQVTSPIRTHLVHPPPCTECKRTTTHGPGCTLAFGYKPPPSRSPVVAGPWPAPTYAELKKVWDETPLVGEPIAVPAKTVAPQFKKAYGMLARNPSGNLVFVEMRPGEVAEQFERDWRSAERELARSRAWSVVLCVMCVVLAAALGTMLQAHG